MIILTLLPVVFSCLLIGAHFLRTGSFVLILMGAAIPCLLVVPRLWAARLVQVYLAIATVEWIRTLVVFVNAYETAGEPWTRLAIILGSVAVFTACSILVFRTKRMMAHYR